MNKLEEKYKRDFSRKLNALYDKKEWEKVKDLLENEIKKFPDEYFLHTSLAKAYFNLKLFEKAYNSALTAYNIEPNDPLVIYDYACTLYSLNKYSEAITQWNKIVIQGVQNIINSEYGESVNWAKSIVNDSLFRLALCYIEFGDNHKSINLINEHLKYRQRGVYSDFTKKQVLKKQKELI
jgi:tetratricopeptide (TPR) repeat protein